MAEEADPGATEKSAAPTRLTDAWVDAQAGRLAADRLAELSGVATLAGKVSAIALAGNVGSDARIAESIVGKLGMLRGDVASLRGMSAVMEKFGYQDAISNAAAGLSQLNAVIEKFGHQQDIMRDTAAGLANAALTGTVVDTVRRFSEIYRSTFDTDRYRNLVGLTGYQASLASTAWMKQLSAADVVHTSHLVEAFKPLAAQHAEMTRAWSSVAALSAQTSQLSAAMAAVQQVMDVRPQLFAIPGLGDGLLTYAGTQSILGAFPDTDNLLRGGTAAAARQLNTYLGSLGDSPTKRRSRVAGLGARGVSSMMLAEALLAPDLEADDAEYLEGESVGQIIEPWQEGHNGYRTDLYAALADINPSLPEFLKGAWADIHTDGPAALIKVATCLTETLDWFLRRPRPGRYAARLARQPGA